MYLRLDLSTTHQYEKTHIFENAPESPFKNEWAFLFSKKNPAPQEGDKVQDD